MADLASILSQKAELVTKASDPDYFLEIAEYMNTFLSHKQSKKILSEISKIKTADSQPYKLAVNTTNQLVESMKTELWSAIDSDKALASDQAIIDLRKRWQGLAQGNIMPMDRTDEFLFVVSDVIERLDKLNAKYDPKLKDLYRKTHREYDQSKRQFEYKQRVSVWNSFEELLRVAYFVASDLEEFRGEPLDRLGAILTKGKFTQHIDRTKPIPRAMRDEYDRHVDRLTLFVKQNVEAKKIGSSIWDAVEKVSVLVGLIIALSPLVTQWLQGPPFPYYRETATVAAVLIGVYLAVRYRTRVIEFFRTRFQRMRSHRRKAKRLTP